MRLIVFLLAVCLLKLSSGTPIIPRLVLQAPLEDLTSTHHTQVSSRQLHGRFLHITDLHPDAHYKIHSSTEEEDACHRGKGVAGIYGAETSDCDTPFALVDATFQWIEENLKDTIDFVVWTGDSARHDNDEDIPRTEEEVLSTNRWIAEKFVDVFSEGDDVDEALTIPIISTFGNNDILPHNILLSGPNKWLKSYADIWSKFIPEEQRHGFERGGWYYVEVIPGKLAVFSLNTLYFFSHNAAVDGCALRSEPGYEHLEWLRIQLQFMRQRGMKAILIGHIPPARTESKQLWDESCWQKYTLWLHKFRDVVVGGLYGHMNIDHFFLQDTKEVNLQVVVGEDPETQSTRRLMDEELSTESANDYLEELRQYWSDLPNPAFATKDKEEASKKKGKKDKGKKSKKEKALKKMGGPWAENFQVTLISPSLVPNFFPTLRIVEYNITGLDNALTWAAAQPSDFPSQTEWLEEGFPSDTKVNDDTAWDDEEEVAKKKKKKKGKKHKKKPKNPDLIIPSPPSKDSPPGPAYSPQPFTMLGYTQYFANLTHVNNDNFIIPDEPDVPEGDIDADKWHGGKHKGKHPKDKIPHPKPFKFQVEYTTFTDKIYNLKDLTVRSYMRLAHRIAQYKPEKGNQIDDDLPGDDKDIESDFDEEDDSENNDDNNTEIEKKKKHQKKHHNQHEKNKAWLRFIKRAFVGTLEEEELQNFQRATQREDEEFDSSHDGEL